MKSEGQQQPLPFFYIVDCVCVGIEYFVVRVIIEEQKHILTGSIDFYSWFILILFNYQCGILGKTMSNIKKQKLNRLYLSR